MAEYIEKEMTLKLLTDSMDAYGTFSVERSIYMTARQKIKNIPAADVAPVVHGKWVKASDCEFCVTLKCSACRMDQPFWAKRDYQYCPNCGAKMDLEKQGKD